jgi:Trypsin
MRIFYALAATGLLVSPAVALDGELVTNGAFPFVVKIRAIYSKPTGYFSICTATVLEPRLILTAAHCISRPYPGADGPDSFVPNISKDITIYYTDTGGHERTAKSKSTFYDRAFLANFFNYTRIMPKPFSTDEARATSFKTLPRSEQEMVMKLHKTYIVADVAYIVPDHRIELKTYPRFIFDDFKPEQYLDGSGKWLTFSNDKVSDITDAFLDYLPNPSTRVDATFVGFGLSQCTDKDLPNTCVKDLKKRWTTLQLFYPFSWRWRLLYTSPNMTNKIADVEFPYLPPWGWVFTKKATDKWNPINKGDSGGPVLISKNGDWIVYGVNSVMTKRASHHANPLHNPGLYQTVISSATYKSLEPKGTARIKR